ncbi:1,2-phenylacetyl-CoA epoxidase subunit PaaD [Nesterenkonia alkaliphila]|uniref:Phenylacetate-CoA oxygenase subunit PaaJ n=1 Tax=Nesterenkonia alkaliphila TaxID=1463631 RepID=A0A7K1UJZ9_9MICC|nr:1,2-phenylacetyl-CoA epoxidase subunit PaaD [Nesterenkonia alkaliphila]MVT26734.1 phenylacetate-CoA oxygenase subunit PaaJ [Nesterenkonia alkaliphila]GFZ77057.1 phenylacetate-CoA oxygenase subunit PaaJ [Nesterenkonia alkaliphila]
MTTAEDLQLSPEGVRPQDPRDAAVWDLAAEVNDPEIPVLSIADLGILRAAAATEEGGGVVLITPTYSGCPAMETITADVRAALQRGGYDPVQVHTVLKPAWTTDWMTDEGKAKLREYGITPPTGAAPVRNGPISVGLSVKCPRCDSLDTRELARFGSTACKALYQCRACLEPFDYFKVL